MAGPERVPLSSIKTLVLYADELTKSRRTAPVPQLECTGSVCRDFQPSSVYCTKAGDSDWKCEADLPASLRFGKLHVSCEGWDRPGDPYVLKGSCGLTYSLVRTPSGNYYGQSAGTDYTTYLVGTGGVALQGAIVEVGVEAGHGEEDVGEDVAAAPTHQMMLHLHTPSTRGPANPTRTNPGGLDFGQAVPVDTAGLGAGGLAAGMYNYLNRPRDTYRPTATAWDWDRASTFSSTGPYRPEPSAFRRRYEYDDSGAGSSTGPGTRLGEMRRATGYANTSVR